MDEEGEAKEEVVKVPVEDSEIVKRRKAKIKMAFSLFDKENNGTVIETYVVDSYSHHIQAPNTIFFILAEK